MLTVPPACPALAMKHMDLKQMELDTAAAKVDELTKQLELLWSDSPAPPGPQGGVPSRVSQVPAPTPEASFSPHPRSEAWISVKAAPYGCVGRRYSRALEREDQ